MIWTWLIAAAALMGAVALVVRAPRRRIAPVAILAMLALVLAPPVASDADTDADLAPVSPASAMSQARATGKQVEVTTLASPTTRVMADPTSGGFLAEVTAQVSRVKAGDGTWIDASSRLVPADDGSWTTQATPVGIAVGGPGSRLFRFVNDGGSVELSWPGVLPVPVVEGSSATYAEVLPGVDLVVRAQISGVGTYLVVKDAAAARNPALDRIDFGFRVDGATATAKDRGLAFNSASGMAKFKLAEPYMWDSRGKVGLEPSREAVSAAPDARMAKMEIVAAGNTLQVTPDLGLLRSADTQFPVVIDPYVHDDPTAVVRITEDWEHVNRWSDDAKLGYNGWTSPYYRSRMYYNFTLPSLTVSDVASAKFYAKQIHSPQHDCNDNDFGPSVTAAVTTQVNGSDTWGHQPTWKSGSDNDDYAVGHEDYCGASYVQKFDLTGAIKTAWAASTKIGIGMKSSSEGDKNGWRHYRQVEGTSKTNPDGTVTSTWYPRIVIDYQPTPLTPSNIVVSNSTAITGGLATTDSRPNLIAKLVTPSGFPCGSTPTSCLHALWTLPSGAVVQTPGVTSGTSVTLTWPATEPALPDGIAKTLTVKALNDVNNKSSAGVTLSVKYDANPSIPAVTVVDPQEQYPLGLGVAVEVSSDPDVREFCWTSMPASSYAGCQPVTGGAGQISLRQDNVPANEWTTTTFDIIAVDQSGGRSSPAQVTLLFTPAP